MYICMAQATAMTQAFWECQTSQFGCSDMMVSSVQIFTTMPADSPDFCMHGRGGSISKVA